MREDFFMRPGLSEDDSMIVRDDDKWIILKGTIQVLQKVLRHWSLIFWTEADFLSSCGSLLTLLNAMENLEGNKKLFSTANI